VKIKEFLSDKELDAKLLKIVNEISSQKESVIVSSNEISLEETIKQIKEFIYVGEESLALNYIIECLYYKNIKLSGESCLSLIMLGILFECEITENGILRVEV